MTGRDTTAITTAGAVRGTFDGRVHEFLGIPYAAAPTGRRRFMPPEPVEAWTGVRDADSPGPSCPQPPDPLPADVIALLGGKALTTEQNEDCLVVNVWTSAVGDGGARPVLVWLHGGAFTMGAGAGHVTRGDRLAARGDVVVVSLNHRIGSLGYLHLPDLFGDRYAASGNVGMLDIVAALEWVRDNIEVFGGDPGRVTLFGVSGGGMKIAALLAMPAARGLFHRVISQSGPGLRGILPDTATHMSDAILKEAGVAPGDLRALETVPAGELIAAQMRVANATPIEAGVQLGPVVDGNVLPTHPIDAVQAGASAEVAMVIGTNIDEMGLMLAVDPRYGSYGGAMTEDDLSTRLGRLTSRPAELLDAYRANRPSASAESLLVAILSDRMRVSALQLAEAKAAGGTASVFVYLFTWPSPILEGRCGSFHALELPFVFDCVDRAASADGGPESEELAARMSGAWVAFAQNGEPTTGQLPAWLPYAAGDRPTMLFDVDCRVELDPYKAERQIIEELGLAW